MSQQVNLLPPERHAFNAVAIALLVWGLVLLALAGLWSFNQIRLAAAREANTRLTTELQQAKADLQQRIDAKAALNAEIEALRPYADAAQKFMGMTETLGNTTGFSRHFSTVASATEDGLWLTGMTVAGARIQLVEGHSLSNEAVMRFSRNLNTVFAGESMQFSIVEMTPQTVGTTTPGAPADRRPLMVSTRFSIR